MAGVTVWLGAAVWLPVFGVGVGVAVVTVWLGAAVWLPVFGVGVGVAVATVVGAAICVCAWSTSMRAKHNGRSTLDIVFLFFRKETSYFGFFC